MDLKYAVVNETRPTTIVKSFDKRNEALRACNPDEVVRPYNPMNMEFEQKAFVRVIRKYDGREYFAYKVI